MDKLMAVTDLNTAHAKMVEYIQAQMRRKDEEALRDLLDSPSGRWFLMRMFDKTKLISNSFTGNSSTFFNEGRRAVGVELMNEITCLGLDAFTKKQLAEREYILQQQEYKQLYLQSLKEDKGDE